MCGRVRMAQHNVGVVAIAVSKVGETVQCTPAQSQWKGSENIHPGCLLPVLYRNEKDNRLTLSPMIWGLIPSYVNRACGEPCNFF